LNNEARSFRRIALSAACASLLWASGCSQAEPGNPEDFKPVDTSKAISSEDAKEMPPGQVDDGTGKIVKPR
jgi:hypothetical protein